MTLGRRITGRVARRSRTAAGKEQVIAQAELPPVVVATLIWREQLKDLAVITFVDNESAKHALISGYSPIRASLGILNVSAELDAGLALHQWVTRVPSASNPADAPSRLEFAHLRPDRRTRLAVAVQRELLRCLL